MLNTDVFPMLFLGGKKSKISRLGAPTGRHGYFVTSADVPFSDFAQGGPKYQKSKYIFFIKYYESVLLKMTVHEKGQNVAVIFHI